MDMKAFEHDGENAQRNHCNKMLNKRHTGIAGMYQADLKQWRHGSVWDMPINDHKGVISLRIRRTGPHSKARSLLKQLNEYDQASRGSYGSGHPQNRSTRYRVSETWT